MTATARGLKARLARADALSFTLFAGLAGFCAYFSMYAFRKPFTAATFEGVEGWTFAVDYKVALVIAQLLGYALSKWIGIKLIAEADEAGRCRAILGLIGFSWLALVGFALTPAPWKVGFLFLNGLPLGLIWGLVFGFMEGRRVSDVLGAILCSSFILSSGVVKAVGKMLLQAGVSEVWMPAAAGAVFSPLLLMAVYGLSQLPPPSEADEAARVRRSPMGAAERARFLRDYWPGVALMTLAYVFLTVFRDFRDNFSAEIWQALGQGQAASVFAASEAPVAVAILVLLGGLMLIRNNRHAFFIMHGVVIGRRGADRFVHPMLPARGSVAHALDGGQRHGSVHGLHAFQRRHVRPYDRRHRARGDGWLPHLPGRRGRILGDCRHADLSQLCSCGFELAAVFHCNRLCDRRRCFLIDSVFIVSFLASFAQGLRQRFS